jgi:hypothetical protein
MVTQTVRVLAAEKILQILTTSAPVFASDVVRGREGDEASRGERRSWNGTLSDLHPYRAGGY